MASTKYTYSVADDTLNGVLSPNAFEAEVRASAIVTAFDYMITVGDVMDVWMKDALSSGDEDLLDALVAAHTGVALDPAQETILLGSPKTTDGKPIFLPCLFPGGVYLYIAGSSDDPDDGIGEGDLFQISSEIVEDTTKEFHFNDAVYLAGGGMSWMGGRSGDYISFLLEAHATTVTPNGSNLGNCDLVDPGVGSAILIVPAAGDGAYDVDLATAIPVPAFTDDFESGNGFYDFDAPMIGNGTITVGTPQQALWNLYTVSIPLSRFASKLPMMGDDSQALTIPAVKPKKILPQWCMRVTVHHAGTEPLSVGWYLTGARVRTV